MTAISGGVPEERDRVAPGRLELVRQFVNTRDYWKGIDWIDSPERLSAWLVDQGLVADGWNHPRRRRRSTRLHRLCPSEPTRPRPESSSVRPTKASNSGSDRWSRQSRRPSSRGPGRGSRPAQMTTAARECTTAPKTALGSGATHRPVAHGCGPGHIVGGANVPRPRRMILGRDVLPRQ